MLWESSEELWSEFPKPVLNLLTLSVLSVLVFRDTISEPSKLLFRRPHAVAGDVTREAREGATDTDTDAAVEGRPTQRQRKEAGAKLGLQLGGG